jgi:hypothetical protein
MNVKEQALKRWLHSFTSDDMKNGFQAALVNDQVEVMQHKRKHSTVCWNEELYRHLSRFINIKEFSYLDCKTYISHIGNDSFRIYLKVPQYPNEFRLEFIVCSEKEISIWFFTMHNKISSVFIDETLKPFFQASLDYFKQYFANIYPSQRVRFLLEEPFEYCYEAKTYFKN